MFKSFSLQLAVYIVTTMASIETSFAAGSSTCNDPKSPPELTVTISQERIELGQIWELYGKISNSSNCDIYIVNSWAPMGISPSIRPNDEILVRSQGANFLEPGQGSRSLRIPARNSAHLLWRIGDSNSYVMNRERRAKLRELQKISDSCTKLTTSINFTENEEDTECSKKRAFVRASQIRSLAAKEPTLGELISDALHEFSKQAFFVSPGAYEAQFVVHYWYTAPFVKYEPEPESNKSLSGECSELAQKFFAAQTDSKAEELLGKQLAACVATSGDSFDVLGLVEPPNGSGTILPSDGIVLGHKSVNINHSPLVTIVGGGIGGLLGYIFIGLSTIGKSRTQTRDNSQKLSIRELMDTKGNLWKYFILKYQ